MSLNRDQIFTISRETVVSSISNYIRKRANTVPNFQILDLIIPTERKIRSIVGGMETSLGNTLWEPLAKSLASSSGFQIIEQDLKSPLNMPNSLQSTVDLLAQGRLNGDNRNTAIHCHNSIKEICQTFIQAPISDFVTARKGFGVDIWLVKNDINYLFDTKTVQPSLGDYTKYFTQIMNWYAYFYSRYPESQASARIVFPYNPYGQKNFWANTKGRGWPLEADNEAWVENQFWDFCTGIDGTYEIIISAFTSISESGDLEEIIQNIFYGTSSTE